MMKDHGFRCIILNSGGDIPDADHVHLARQPDGTWTATPMREVEPAAQLIDGKFVPMFTQPVWFDVAAGVDGEAS